jgi:tripartite-type tricarboxylate transporter receptor subunit TctC
VVPYGAGGPTDVIGRLFAQQMSERLGRQIIVENVVGAGGMTGANRVANAPPDGYQVLFGGSGNLVFNQVLYKKPLFNSVTDFTPVALLTEQSLVLVARKDLPGDGLQDFIRRVKASKTASFGSSGAGSSTHLGCVMLNLAMGADATHVPYRGNVAVMQDLMGGRIDYFCDIIVTAVPHVQAGNVKAIAILSPSRSPMLPDLRTADEQGLAGFDTANWYGLFLPKGTPSSIVRKLHDAALAALDTPSFRDQLRGLGVEVVAPERRSSDYLARFLKDDIAKWAVPIKASGITVD